jgi:YCII-related domain
MTEAANPPPRRELGGRTKTCMVWCSTQGHTAVQAAASCGRNNPNMLLTGAHTEVILDVPDMDTARAFVEKEPFYSNGVYQESHVHRWRFGRVMDRFK